MNKLGLYSKAAKLIRSLPQERGTVEQMIAAAKAKGLKEAELANAGKLPTGKINREDLAQLFETRLPQVTINQYGENPNYLSREEARELRALEQNPQDIPLMPFEQNRMAELRARRSGAMPIGVEMREDEEGNEEPEDTRYKGYNLPGGQNYRERLLRLTQYDHPVKNMDRTIGSKERQLEYETPIYGADHPIIQQSRQRLEEMRAERERAAMLHGEPWTDKEKYHSSHWDSHPNVIAHIRMQDRQVGEDKATIQSILQRLATMAGVDDVRHLGSGAVHVGLQNGVITPQEAASVSRAKGWYTGHENKPGIGKRLLHVEELQSDWGQEGRDKGFHDPKNPYEIFETKTGKTVSKHPTYEAMWDAFRSMPDEQSAGLDYGSAAREKPAEGPYVTNTQHWTDLALKNVLREAALGNYDGIVFTPGKAQANRYGLEKQLDALHYEPETQSLYGEQNGRKVVEKSGVKPEELGSYVGKDAAEKLMNPENHYQYGNTIRSTLTGGDLKMGGRGMVKYYDEMVPKSVLKLAKMHDPDIKPAEPVGLSDNEEDYQGFHLPMTQKLRQGILNEGFPAMRRGGSVDAALAATRRFTKDGQHVTMRLKD